MKHLFTTILIAILLLSCQNRPKTKKQDDNKKETTIYEDSLTNKLSALYEQGYINGFAVALVNDHGTLYQKGFGTMDKASKKDYTEHTIQNIGSISKTFIGIALLKAQEMGKLNLDDPINDHLPFKVVNPYYPNEDITIRHLATHTSTIVDTEFYDAKAYVLKDEATFKDLEGLVETLNPPSARMSLMEFLPKILESNGEFYKKEGFLKAKPNTTFEYSNIGATLAALILETSTDEPFDVFTSVHILKPLNMSSSGWSYDSIDFSRHSKLYSNTDSELSFYSLITYPDGGMRSSANDMGKYVTEMIKGKSGNGTLLNAESYQEFFSEQLDTTHFTERDGEFPYNDEYNMGIFMGHSGNGDIGHTGGDPGISTLMFFNPKTRVGRFLMINTSLINEEGVNEFFIIMNTLGDYEGKLNR